MEKYSRFRDEGTGIAPFQKARRNSKEYSVIARILLFFISILSTLVGSMSFLAYFIFIDTIFPKSISSWILKRFILSPLRVFYSTFSYEGERKASVRKKSIRKVHAGDIILSNFVSPLDPLIYVAHLGSVKFVFPTSQGTYEVASTYQTIKRALSVDYISNSSKKLDKITNDAKKSNAVIVLFVEGTTTNGRGLLTLSKLGSHELANTGSEVYGAAIKYTPASATAPIPQTIIGYFWYISTATWWYMASIKVSGEPLPKSALNPENIGKSIAGLGRLRILGDRLDIDSKKDFVRQTSKRN